MVTYHVPGTAVEETGMACTLPEFIRLGRQEHNRTEQLYQYGKCHEKQIQADRWGPNLI